MTFFKDYMDYVHDNPNHYWFKRKIWGWGWTPVTKEGWAVTLGFIAIIFFFAFTIDKNAGADDIVFSFFLPLIVLAGVLIGICYKTGEPPEWQWGFPEKDEDTGETE